MFNKDPKKIAIELLGMTLVRECEQEILKGRIVETEAYYGEKDPASRAKHGKKRYNAPMFDGAGKLFIYNVHKYWMLNFTTKPVSAVLIRAVEPLNFEGNTKGPGKLTERLKIDKSLNALPIGKETGIWVEKGTRPSKIGASNRIGVSSDLKTPLRFFDMESEWVSSHKKAIEIL